MGIEKTSRAITSQPLCHPGRPVDKAGGLVNALHRMAGEQIKERLTWPETATKG